MIGYAKPRSVAEALGLLAAGRWRIVAGGTDFYPAQGARPLRDDVLDINGLSELRGIAETPDHWMLGARTTWTDIVRQDLPSAFDALSQAAREVGSVQIQNTGTLAGNLCNASPAADGVPALMVLDAEVELRSAAGTRHLPLPDFILGNRRTALRPDELMTAIRVPKRSAGGSSAFVKLGARRYHGHFHRHGGGPHRTRRRRTDRDGGGRGRVVLGRSKKARRRGGRADRASARSRSDGGIADRRARRACADRRCTRHG